MLDISSVATTESDAATEAIEGDESSVAATPAAALAGDPLNTGDMAAITGLIEKLICEVQVAYRETREDAERRVHGWMVAMGLQGNHGQWFGRVPRSLG
ncbi:MAG TPA: hypothetical protein VH858_10060 [Hyphomicrobiales bacterium]|jgi:hypothetical protein